jgi:hypothetical protein
MKKTVVNSINEIVILEIRNESYLESVLIGLQAGIVLLPLEIVRQVIYPFCSGLYYIGAVIKGAIEDVVIGVVNVVYQTGLALYYGFQGRFALKEE